jgi:hypothetical protein
MSAVRSLEVLGALSRATDLGTGLPDEHALRTAPIAALAELAGADGALGGHCEVAARLAERLGCSEEARAALDTPARGSTRRRRWRSRRP